MKKNYIRLVGLILVLVVGLCLSTRVQIADQFTIDIDRFALTSGSYDSIDPAFSGDFTPSCVLRGDVVAYVGEDTSGYSVIYTQRKNATSGSTPFNDAIAQMEGESGVVYARPQWSPSGTSIIFERMESGVTTLQYLEWTNAEIDCGDPTPSNCPELVDVPNSADYDSDFDYKNAHWGPCGAIVYQKEERGIDRSHIEVYCVACDDVEVSISESSTFDSQPRLSSDSLLADARIAFVRRSMGQALTTSEIHVASDLEGSVDVDQVTDDLTDFSEGFQDENPQWGQDLNASLESVEFILYNKLEDREDDGDFEWHIYDVHEDQVTAGQWESQQKLTAFTYGFPKGNHHLRPTIGPRNNRKVLYTKERASHNPTTEPSDWQMIFRLRRPDLADTNSDPDDLQITDRDEGEASFPPEEEVYNDRASWAANEDSFTWQRLDEGTPAYLQVYYAKSLPSEME